MMLYFSNLVVTLVYMSVCVSKIDWNHVVLSDSPNHSYSVAIIYLIYWYYFVPSGYVERTLSFWILHRSFLTLSRKQPPILQTLDEANRTPKNRQEFAKAQSGRWMEVCDLSTSLLFYILMIHLGDFVSTFPYFHIFSIDFHLFSISKIQIFISSSANSKSNS